MMVQRNDRPRTGLKWAGLLLSAIVLLALLAAVFWRYIPYQDAAEWQMRRTLAAYGLEVEKLTVESVDADSVVLADVQLGREYPLTIRRLTAHYTLQDARRGKLKELHAEGVKLHVRATPDGWRMGGLEALPTKSAQEKNNPWQTVQALLPLLPDRAVIKDMQLKLDGGTWQGEGAMKLEWNAEATPALRVESTAFSVNTGVYSGALTSFVLTATPNTEKQRWTGNVKGEAISLQGVPLILPALSAKGGWNFSENNMDAALQLRSADNTTRADLALTAPPGDPLESNLVITNARLPWKGGTLGAARAMVPLRMDKPVSATLRMENIDIAALLEEVGGGKVKGTGILSGTLPVIWHPGGAVDFLGGELHTSQKGTLSLSPEALPAGANEQMDQVKAALQNFHYTSLSVKVISGSKEQLALRLGLEGNSPDAFQGKPVKLTVNLSGDVLPFLRQSVMPMNNPAELLKQEKP